MAGQLPKSPSEFLAIPQARIAIIGSLWHGEYVSAMIERAKQELFAVGVAPENIQVHRLPGSLELPFAARVLFEQQTELDAILAFGVVLQGATTHNLTVVQQVAHGFDLVSDRFGKPIINEVIGVSDLADAKRRAGDDLANKGVEAVFAVSELLSWLTKVKKRSP